MPTSKTLNTANQTTTHTRYDAYKASSVEWLGEIPEHWETVSLKYATDVIYNKLEQKPESLPYLGMEHVESGTGRLVKTEPVEEVSSTVCHYQKGDVLFGKLRPYLAKVYQAEQEGVGTTEWIPLRVQELVDSGFLSYQLLSSSFIDHINALTYGVKMPRVSPDQIGSQVIVRPPLPEQRAIAAYLDRETERIDALVKKKEQLIELLEEKSTALISHAVTKGLDADAKMKDSGVEWIGKIPAGWEVVCLKHIADVQGGIAKGKRHGDDVDTVQLPYLRVANVQDGFLDLEEISEIEVTLEEARRYALQDGDVLMNEGGDFDKLGRGAVWNGEIAPCLHQNHVFAVRPHEVESDWLAQITRTTYAKHFFILRSVQSTNLASISMSSLKELPVVLPPAQERQHILQTVSQTASTLDTLISKVRDGIDRLKEYRIALISAAVTGQVDVRGKSVT